MVDVTATGSSGRLEGAESALRWAYLARRTSRHRSCRRVGAEISARRSRSWEGGFVYTRRMPCGISVIPFWRPWPSPCALRRLRALTRRERGVLRSLRPRRTSAAGSRALLHSPAGDSDARLIRGFRLARSSSTPGRSEAAGAGVTSATSVRSVSVFVDRAQSRTRPGATPWHGPRRAPSRRAPLVPRNRDKPGACASHRAPSFPALPLAHQQDWPSGRPCVPFQPSRDPRLVAPAWVKAVSQCAMTGTGPRHLGRHARRFRLD